MKKQRLKAAILVGIVAIIGCNRAGEPQAPALISPADGAALYSGLAFIWGAGEEAEEYVIHVWTGSTDVIEDTLTDTTYTMSDSAFSALAYGIYNWAVASKADSKLAWSESRTFSLTQPGAPKLIAPQDGAVFDTEPPTFIWSSDSLEPDYVIRIFTDTTIDLQDTLADTTYTMSDSVFENLSNGTYNWQAGTVVFNGVLLSETRSFIVDKPPPPLDLDTTYFPFGLGYEWCYEKKELFSEGSEDTIAINVVDSFWIDNTFFFKLEGGSFFDVGNSVEIGDGKIKAFDETINLLPEEQSSYLWIQYYGDTLYMFTGDEPYPDYWEDWSVYRIKAIGLIHQIYYWQDVYENTSGGDRYSLLWFYNGQDTVWKAD